PLHGPPGPPRAARVAGGERAVRVAVAHAIFPPIKRSFPKPPALSQPPRAGGRAGGPADVGASFNPLRVRPTAPPPDHDRAFARPTPTRPLAGTAVPGEPPARSPPGRHGTDKV